MIWLKCAVATLVLATLCGCTPAGLDSEGGVQGDREKRTLILGVLFKNLLLQQALGRNAMLNGTAPARPQGMGRARPQGQAQSEAPPPAGPPEAAAEGPPPQGGQPQQGPSAPQAAALQQEQPPQEATPPPQGAPPQQGPSGPPPQVPVSAQGASPLQQLTISQPPPSAPGFPVSRLPSLSVYGPPQASFQQGSVFPPNFPFGIQGFRQLPFGPAPPLGAQAGPQANFPFGVYQFPSQGSSGPAGSFAPTSVSASGGQFAVPPSAPSQAQQSPTGADASQGPPPPSGGDAGQALPPPQSAPGGAGAPQDLQAFDQSSAVPPPTQSSPGSVNSQVPSPPQAGQEPQSGPGNDFSFGPGPSAQPPTQAGAISQGSPPDFTFGPGPTGPPPAQAGTGGDGAQAPSPPQTGFGGDASQGSLQDFLRLLQQGQLGARQQGTLPPNFLFGTAPNGAPPSQGPPPQAPNFQFDPSGPGQPADQQSPPPSDQQTAQPDSIPPNFQLGPLDNNLQQAQQQQQAPNENNQPPPPPTNGFPSNLGDFQLTNESPQPDQTQSGLFDPSQFSGSDNNVFDFPQQNSAQSQPNDNSGQQQSPQQAAFPNNFQNGLFTAPDGGQQQFSPDSTGPQSNFAFNGQQFDFASQFPQDGGSSFQRNNIFPQNFF